TFGADGGDNERWNNAGWDEDVIRWHFVPVADALAPPLNGQCNNPSAPTTGSTLWRRMFGGSHPGGINALLGGGPVKFFNSPSAPRASRRLAVIGDGEVLSADSYGPRLGRQGTIPHANVRAVGAPPDRPRAPRLWGRVGLRDPGQADPTHEGAGG